MAGGLDFPFGPSLLFYELETAFVFGSNIDRIVQNSPAQVSLVKVRRDHIGDVVALVGEGPISPMAARQAYEIAASEPDSSLTLLNVESPDVDDPEAVGHAILETVADKAGIPEDAYEPMVEVGEEGEDVQQTLLDATADFGTVYIGASGDAAYKQALFGSIPGYIGEWAPGNVIMVNQPYQPRTIFEAIRERIGG